MTNRELLELAAKAFGIPHGIYVEGFEPDRWDGPTPYKGGYGIKFFVPLAGYALWNPAEDDGEAFRLAVQLHIDFRVYEKSVRSLAIDEERQRVIASFEEPIADDVYSCARRVIVRAAAEIGRQK